MRQKLISVESSELIALVWQKTSKDQQQLAIDLITNLIRDYYLTQRKASFSIARKERGKQ